MARKVSALRTELDKVGISRQRLCEYRKLAKIPLKDFERRLAYYREHRKPITFRGIMRGEQEDTSVIDIG